MSAKPWADPRQPLDERLDAAEVAIANVDTAAARIAIMRELVEGAEAVALEKAPALATAAAALGRELEGVRRALNAMKADAPGS